ncbi:MAG TPA: hypothetical protein VI299_12220 [Polyangiales bacterium]
MEKDTRSKVVGHLDELRDQVAQKLGGAPEVTQHVEQLRALVEQPNAKEAHSSASSLEQRLLAWEAEHPTLVALATRVVRALEDSGL